MGCCKLKPYIINLLNRTSVLERKIDERFEYYVLDYGDPLPEASSETMYIIYLVQPDPDKETRYEYITVRKDDGQGGYTYSWEKLGSTDIDLAGYAKKEDLERVETKTNKNSEDIDKTTVRCYRNGGYNMNECLWYGEYYECTSGRPSGSTEGETYYLKVANVGKGYEQTHTAGEIITVDNVWEGAFTTYDIEGTTFAERYYGAYPAENENIMYKDINTGIPNASFNITLKFAYSCTRERDTWIPEWSGGNICSISAMDTSYVYNTYYERTAIDSLSGVLEISFNNIQSDSNGRIRISIDNAVDGANWFIIHLDSVVLAQDAVVTDPSYLIIKQECHSSKDLDKCYSRFIYSKDRSVYTSPTTIHTQWQRNMSLASEQDVRNIVINYQ